MPPLTLILRQLASPLNTSAYFLAKICLVTFLRMNVADLLVRRPDVLQEDLLALLIDAERLLRKIDIHRAGDGVGDDERRRGEIVGAHVGVDAAFEVAIARQHRGGDQIVVVDRLGILRRQRTGIADAGGAAEADEIEAELVEILLQAGLVEIFADHLRAGRQRRLHPRLDGEALGRGLAGEQAGADHHARIGGVGAGGDRGDHHVAVAEIVVLACRPARASSSSAPLPNSLSIDAARSRLFTSFSGDAVLRTLRAGERRLDRDEIELEDVGEHRIGRRS